jgi:LacI family transcriptional regulator
MISQRIGLVFNATLGCCRDMLRGIRRYAENKPDWLFAPVAPTASGLGVLRRLQPDGLIAQIFNPSLAKNLTAFRRPIVNAASYHVSPVLRKRRIPRVGADNEQIGRLAATYLLDRGLHNFGFVGHPRRGFSLQRQASFRQTIEVAGYAVLRFEESESLAHGQLCHLWAPDAPLLQWLRAAPKPIGLFACQDAWGVHLVEACHRAELHVPDEVALLGVDDDDLVCELSRPALSSIALPHERIGHEAAALLDRLLSGAKPVTQAVQFPPLGVVPHLSTDVLCIADAEVAAAVRFIRERGHLPLHVRDVLRAVSLSRRALERRFQRALHHSLGEEIRRVHLERAKTLLARTDLPTPEVAVRSGFSNAKHLATMFHAQLGLTPLAYRRQFRAE